MNKKNLLTFIVFVSVLFFAGNKPLKAQTVANLTNESGNFSEYDLVQTNDGNLTVTGSAAMAGTNYGLRVNITPDKLQYAVKTLSLPSTTGIVRARFYIDPNSVNLPEGTQFSFLFLINSGGTENFALMKMRKIGGQYNLRGVMIDDNGIHRETRAWPISDGPHMAEIRVKKSTSATSNDATYETWIDGVQKETMTGVDSFNRFKDFKYISFGLNGIAGIVSGSYYLDELIVNTDGNPFGNSPTPGPTNQTKTGDINRDGKVDIVDIGIAIDNYGSTTANISDLNHDGKVNIIDIGIIIDNYGK